MYNDHRPTLSEAESCKHTQFQFVSTLCAIDRRLVGPQAQPVIVSQRGGLLEGTEEDDGHDEGQANGPEVLFIHLQLHLATEGQLC